MRLSLLFLSFVTLSCFSQNIEQKALDYFAQNILPIESRKDNYFYNGVITHVSYDSSSIESLLYSYYFCKQDDNVIRKKSAQKESYIHKYEEIDELMKTFRPTKLIRDSSFKLTLPKPIKKSNKYKTAKAGGFIGKAKRFLIGTNFSLTLYQNFEIGAIYFVQIDTTRRHDKSGGIYYILLNRKGDVLDWCKSFWIS